MLNLSTCNRYWRPRRSCGESGRCCWVTRASLLGSPRPSTRDGNDDWWNDGAEKASLADPSFIKTHKPIASVTFKWHTSSWPCDVCSFFTALIPGGFRLNVSGFPKAVIDFVYGGTNRRTDVHARVQVFIQSLCTSRHKSKDHAFLGLRRKRVHRQCRSDRFLSGMQTAVCRRTRIVVIVFLYIRLICNNVFDEMVLAICCYHTALTGVCGFWRPWGRDSARTNAGFDGRVFSTLARICV